MSRSLKKRTSEASGGVATQTSLYRRRSADSNAALELKCELHAALRAREKPGALIRRSQTPTHAHRPPRQKHHLILFKQKGGLIVKKRK